MLLSLSLFIFHTTKAGRVSSTLSKDDILEIKREKQVHKAEALRAAAMASEEAKE
jgi:hypothetical protein